MDVNALSKRLDDADAKCSRAVSMLSALAVIDIGAMDPQGNTLVDAAVVHELARMSRDAVIEGKTELQHVLAGLLDIKSCSDKP